MILFNNTFFSLYLSRSLFCWWCWWQRSQPMTKTKRIHHSIQMVWKRTNRSQQMAAWMALTMIRDSSKWNFMSEILIKCSFPPHKFDGFFAVGKKSSIKIYWNINERIRHTHMPHVYVNLSLVINHAMTTTDHEIEMKYRTFVRIHS